MENSSRNLFYTNDSKISFGLVLFELLFSFPNSECHGGNASYVDFNGTGSDGTILANDEEKIDFWLTGFEFDLKFFILWYSALRYRTVRCMYSLVVKWCWMKTRLLLFIELDVEK